MGAEITIPKAILFSVAHTFLYVGVLYLREASRPSPTKSKDVPSVIIARSTAVLVAVAISVLSNRFIIEQARQTGYRTGIPVWDNILGGWGEWQPDVGETFRALRLTALLFWGPLVERIWIWQEWRRFPGGIRESLSALIGWRNYIFVWPWCHFSG
jgi:prenyl protein peptidase